MNRGERRAAEARGEMTNDVFVAVADRFIDLANRENARVKATDLHLIMAYATARYAAHVGKNVLAIEEHEPFVEDMMKNFGEMLRNHLADPNV